MKSVPDYADRILEIHGPNMFNMFHVDRAIKFAEAHGLNGLIFHCNDLLDRLILPSKYFTKQVCLENWPVREATLMNNQYYMHGVLKKCKDAGLNFFAEVKEIYYPQDILELYPNLRKENGAICATDPFWWEFIEEKVSEFTRRFPTAAGIVVSPGTRESMVSFAANRCTCERCKNYNVDDWYKNLIAAMYRPLAKAGMRLVVRDFSYTADHQFAMVEAARSVSKDITMALKKAPHDYYPTFPDNPAIGCCGSDMRQWVEFDTWGQYFGLGVFPCSVVEDMQGRLQRYLNKGVSGVMLRTDWEIISQGSVFNSFNILNLIAGAELSNNVNANLDMVYDRWVSEGLYSPLIHDSFAQIPCVPTAPNAKIVFKELMKRSWQIIEKIDYIRGHVFQENVQIFDRYFMAYDMMIHFHSRDDWDPGASARVEPTDENLSVIFKEKDEGVALAESLRELVKPDELGLTEEIKKYLNFMLDMYILYAKIMRHQAHTVCLTRRAEQTKKREDIEAAIATLEGYDEEAAILKEYVEDKAYSNEIEWCLDGNRVLHFKDDVASVLNAI